MLGVVAMTGLVAGGSLASTAVPAQAVPGVTVVSTPSIADSFAKFAVAECPPGTVVYGAAGRIVNGDGKVLITDMEPDSTLARVRVQGVENDPYIEDWRVVAIAICAPDNGHNLHLVEAPSTANGQPVAPRSAYAFCPAGQVMFGTGFKVNDAGGNILIAEVEPETNPMTGVLDRVEVEVRQDNGFAGGFDQFAYAVCGDADGSVVTLESQTSATGTDPSYEVTTGACPQGSVTGVGGKVTDNVDGVLLDRFELNPSVTRTTVRGWDNAMLGGPYDVTAFSICVD
jgi:hypothetical protein